MLITKPSIAISDLKFADSMVSKSLLFAKSSSKDGLKQTSKSFWERFSLIYAFPLLIINRNTSTISHKTNVKNITNNQSPNMSIYKVTVNPQVLIPQNNTVSTPLGSIGVASETSLRNTNQSNLTNVKSFFTDPSAGHNSRPIAPNLFVEKETLDFLPQMLSNTSEKTQTTFPNRTFRFPHTEGNLLTIQTLKIKALHTIGKELSELTHKRIPLHSKNLHRFADQLTGRLNNIENNAGDQELTALRVPSYKNPEIPMIQRNTPDFGGYEPVSTEHGVRSQPQARRGMTKKVDDESIFPKTREKMLAPNLDGLVDKIYQLIERKARIERERRG